MTRLHVVALLWVCACGGAHEPSTPVVVNEDITPPPGSTAAAVAVAAPTPAPAPVIAATPPPAPPPAPPPPPPSVFGGDLVSFAVKEEATIHADAKSSSAELGTLRGGTRIAVRELGAQVAGDKCRWMAIEPRGWICARGEPSKLPPTADTGPSLWMPGYDGRVFKDADDVRANGGHVPDEAPEVIRPFPAATVDIDGKKYLHTAAGELVPQSAVPTYWGGEYSGVELEGAGAAALPVAWTWFHETWEKPTPVRAEPSRKAKTVRGLPLRSRIEVLAEQDGWVRIGTDEWVERDDVRIARAVAPPPEVTGADEVWVDVAQQEQTLVLYRGKTPIHATLVSTGRPKYGTPTGIFHIKKKTAVTEFNSPRPDIVDYHIKDVAWVMHINDLYALHGAWWNRGFGVPISLGCVDIPAADIRVVYNHVEPKVPAGWWQVFATDDNPGSIVRIRER